MKLLITGASGFLGRRAAVHFSALGYQVLTPSHGELNVTDRSAVRCWFQENRPQAVMHCAAVSDTGACQRDPEQTAKINVDGSTHLAAACANAGAKLVFCSSDQVYVGSPLPGPHAEQESLAPGNVYAQQKLLAEQECTQLCPDTVSLRLSWMYSTDFYPGEHGHLQTTLLSALQDDTKPLSWPIHDHRGITDAADVVTQLPSALYLPAGVYNFGAENDTDTFHTMERIFSRLGLTQALHRLHPNTMAFADAPRDIRMNTSLAASLGIRFGSTKDGLTKALKQYL